MKIRLLLLLMPTVLLVCSVRAQGGPDKELQCHLAKGWNTWNTYSVLSHVLLPDGLAINLELTENRTHKVLTQPLIGRRGKDVEVIRPGTHAYDGSYTDVTVAWLGFSQRVQTAHAGLDQVILISPCSSADAGGSIVIRPTMLWNREGKISKGTDYLEASLQHTTITIYAVSRKRVLLHTEKDSLILAASLSDTVAISTGKRRSIEEISMCIRSAEEVEKKQKDKYGDLNEVYNAMHTVLAWDVIYEPTLDMVIAPVSRIWNTGWNGWVLFDWDTYFASYMLSLDNKDLAYSNAIAITKQITSRGFIPNFGSGLGRSDDRSQPPVGSCIVKEIYKKYREKWFLNQVFESLLQWNRWWDTSRELNGYLCWGSNPYELAPGHAPLLSMELGKLQAAKWESGLDNSPMYDDAVFDTTRHLMLLADVGLLSLYVMDCGALAEIANELRRPDIARELQQRGDRYAASLQRLWNDTTGMFLNRRLDNNEISHRLSPTLFYPLLAGVATQKQARRMINEHFYDPKEFWGDWIMPSIARNDAGYKDNEYWRGRIWAPMNFLVYLGLRKYDAIDARRDLVEKSKALLLKSWLQEHHVYENYNSDSGQGDDVPSSDKFYHWGALLGFMSLIDNGYLPPPEKHVGE